MISSSWTETPGSERAAGVAGRLGAADRRQALAPGGAGLAEDVELPVAPVRGHLASAGGGVLRGPDGGEEDLVGRDAEREDEREVPVVGEEPVVAGPKRAGQPEQQRLMAGAGDVEVRAPLLVQDELAVVERARDAGEAEVGAQLVDGDPPVGRSGRLRRLVLAAGGPALTGGSRGDRHPPTPAWTTVARRG